MLVELFPGEGASSRRVERKGIDTLTIPDVRAGGPDLRKREGVEEVMTIIETSRKARKVFTRIPPPVWHPDTLTKSLQSDGT